MTTKRMPQSANEWIVALNEAPGDEALHLAHRRWLADSESNRRDWNEARQVWDLMAMTLPAHTEEWDRPTARPTARSSGAAATRRAPQSGRRGREDDRRRRVRRRRGRLGAAGVALAACLALALLPDALIDLQADHSSSTGEVKVVDLEDGSRIHLAPESAVALAFDPSVRRVELLRGDAFFEVAAETGRTFRVRAGSVETVVLGTRFAVSLRPDGAQVAVEEGSVRVDGPSARAGTVAAGAELSAGEMLRVGRDGTPEKAETLPSLIAAWRKGLLVAQDRPLAELAAVLDRYFEGWIIVADPRLAREPLTGIYTLSDPKAALGAMAEAQGAKLREISPWVLVVSRR